MKKLSRNLLGIVLFLNYLTKNKKIFINDNYEKNCNLYNEKIKNKLNKKIERCLDVLSTCEEEESESDYESKKEKKFFFKKIEKHRNNLNSTNIQNSFLLFNIKLTERKKIYLAKSSKNLDKINHIFNTDKKSNLNFRKIEKINLFSIKKLNNNNNMQNKILNNSIIKENCINLSINHLNKKTKEFLNRNSINDIIKQYKIDKNNKSLRIMNKSNKYKINNIYEEKDNKKNLPEINTPLKKLIINNDKFSLNESENYTIIPLVLPNIHTLLKNDNPIRYLKKHIFHKEFKKQKNS